MDTLACGTGLPCQNEGVRGYPTIIFVDGASGKELGRSGYRKGGPGAWTQNAETIIK